MRPADIAAAVSAQLEPHEWEAPTFTPEALTRLKAGAPDAAARFDAKVRNVRAVASSNARVDLRPERRVRLLQVLRALGLEPAVWHLNEGHAAFVALQRIRDAVERGSSTTRPSISKRVVPGAPPPSGTALVIATALTPGCACRRSSTGRYSLRCVVMFG